MSEAPTKPAPPVRAMFIPDDYKASPILVDYDIELNKIRLPLGLWSDRAVLGEGVLVVV